MITDDKRKPEKDWTDAEIVEFAKGNHTWVNAFSLVNPSDEVLIELGRTLVKRLKESTMCDDLSGTFPMTYIRVNAS